MTSEAPATERVGNRWVIPTPPRHVSTLPYRLNRRWNEDKLFYYLTRRAVEGKPLPYHRLIAEPIG